MKLYVLKTLMLACLILNSVSCVAEVNAKTPKTTPKSDKKETIKVALLLDTSSSMDGLINQAKAQLWEIVNELSYAKCKGETPSLKIALYEYGNSTLSSKSGYIKQVSEFTSDLDQLSEYLFGLTTSGGDEYCGEVIDTAVKKLEWGKNEDDLKMVFIAGNEPFTQGKVNFKDAIANAMEHDITINTIFCGDIRQGMKTGWKEGADLGGGDYMTIDHNKEIVYIETPYDSQIIILNKKLNDTYVYYGNKGVVKYRSQKREDENAEKMSTTAIVTRGGSKSSSLYENSSWDLVDASKNKAVDYDNIKKSTLPKKLQSKSNNEIKEYVEEKRKERSQIQREIQELTSKRKKYVVKAKSGKSNDNELESALINAIKKQAKKKNYAW